MKLLMGLFFTLFLGPSVSALASQDCYSLNQRAIDLCITKSSDQKVNIVLRSQLNGEILLNSNNYERLFKEPCIACNKDVYGIIDSGAVFEALGEVEKAMLRRLSPIYFEGTHNYDTAEESGRVNLGRDEIAYTRDRAVVPVRLPATFATGK